MGPLMTSWCMRMEAKNSYFKRIAQIGNFKNIALSVARRHQKFACAQLNCHNYFEDPLLLGQKSKYTYVLAYTAS